MNKSKTIEDECYILGLWAAGLGSIGIILYFKFIVPYMPTDSCVFLKFFELYCPGCGGTRSVNALFHGNYLSSLWYHPVVLYTAVIYGGFMLTHTMQKLHIPYIKGWRFHTWYLYGALVLTIVNWILRNILLLGFNITL